MADSELMLELQANAEMIQDLQADLDVVTAERDALRAEVDRLSNLLSQEPKLKKFSITEESGAEIEIQHWAVRLICASLWQTFESDGGKNYLVMTVGGLSEKGPMEVTLRPAWGDKRTPMQDLEDARAEVERLRVAAEWQPMETAPMDGTRVLLRSAGGMIYVGRYVHSEACRGSISAVWNVGTGWWLWDHELSGWKPI